MRWSEAMTPVRMQRIALAAPAAALRDMLVNVAVAGVVQLDDVAAEGHSPVGAGQGTAERPPVLSIAEPDLDALRRADRDDVLAGEAQLRAYAAGATHRDEVAALTGWCPAAELDQLATRLAGVGAAVVPMPQPLGVDPPTMLGDHDGLEQAFAPLVQTYGVVPYRDIDPTIPAGIAYVVMFGMMFGDAGHGILLMAAALLLRVGRIRRLASLRDLWLFVGGAGAAATCFGLLYGEFFGPTGVLPVVWLAPLDDPLRLIAAAVAVGAVLLAVAYGIGIVNRWREGGIRLALYASSGIAGAAVFLGIGVVVGGVLLGVTALLALGVVVTLVGLLLAGFGLFTESGGGAAGIAQTGVGSFDLLIRLGSNLVSFARLAAFGMTHAALGWVVWHATVGSTGLGPLGVVAAVVVFLVGNVVTFALEALVAGVQAMRLEFYELFSRVFVDEGRPFRPWRIPTITSEDALC
ncbi:V-type ATPase 116kDa subunit family protein [Nocardia sp. NPDC046473]|uniref:V-type ATPase 116kDa subunit family protein n=1 Tax=Nocardia sp. NPDC046473 TaxID=3155733 RepID=UPI0033F67FE5